MRNILILIITALVSLSGCKSQDPVVIAQREAEEQLAYQKAKVALEKGEFVLEADRVQFKRGYQNVSSMTNFVSRKGNKATVQIAFNSGYGGPNGIGGITVEGTVSNVKIKTDKKGNVSYSMSVMGVGITARVTIDLIAGTNQCSSTVSSNFSGNYVTFTGELYLPEESKVFKARPL